MLPIYRVATWTLRCRNPLIRRRAVGRACAVTHTSSDMSDTDAVSVSRLIALVKEHPVLWDRQEEVYKNRKLTRQAWADICEALIDNYRDLGEHEKLAVGRSIIGKWANLRDNWLRYWRKRQDLLRVGSSTKSLKKYIHHDQLLFLSKVYDPEGQQEVEEIQVEVDVISDPEFEYAVEFDETSQNSWNVPQYPQLSAPPLPQDQSERHLYFFHSIVPMICDFDDDQMLEFHTGVLDLVKRVKRRELNNSHSSYLNCNQGIQESNVDVSRIRIKPETTIQSNCICNSTQQIQVKKEPKSEVSCTARNSEIPESTSTSKVPEERHEIMENESGTIVCYKSEFISLKNTVNRLEKLSGILESGPVFDNKQDMFGRSFSSLLKQLPPKKIQSLKRKMVKEMVRESFKKMKIESASRCIETERAVLSVNSNLDSFGGLSATD